MLDNNSPTFYDEPILPVYPIRAVAKMTGIPLDTIRAWERRYAAVSPRRDERGRVFSQEEVDRLSLLRDVVARGHAIGQVAEASDDDLRELLRRTDNLVEAVPGRRRVRAADSILAPLLKAVEAFDYLQAELELSRLSATVASPREVVHQVALPLMRITGERWHEGRFTIAQEHMVTALLSGLLASLLRIYGTPKPPARIVMATPENEHHGFGILAAAMIAAASGIGAIHLGTSLPSRDIVQTARRTDADAVLLGVSEAAPESLLVALQEIQKGIGRRTQLWLGGAMNERLAKAASTSGWVVLENFDALEHHLGLLKAK